MRRVRKPVRVRVGIASIALVATLAGAAGCTPVTTDVDYAPSDGVRAQAGKLTALNLLVVADEEGDGGRFLGAFSNASVKATDLKVQAPVGTVIVDEEIAGGGLLNYNAINELHLDDLGGKKPGQFLQVVVSSGDQSVDVNVPILTVGEEPGVDTYGDLAN